MKHFITIVKPQRRSFLHFISFVKKSSRNSSHMRRVKAMEINFSALAWLCVDRWNERKINFKSAKSPSLPIMVRSLEMCPIPIHTKTRLSFGIRSAFRPRIDESERLQVGGFGFPLWQGNKLKGTSASAHFNPSQWLQKKHLCLSPIKMDKLASAHRSPSKRVVNSINSCLSQVSSASFAFVWRQTAICHKKKICFCLCYDISGAQAYEWWNLVNGIVNFKSANYPRFTCLKQTSDRPKKSPSTDKAETNNRKLNIFV